jgi:hypothetical protein
MDCDKFEDIMLDELYGELDELTSAAAKRHMAGCARCSALLGGLRATRRVATLPVVSPSEGFEERLLAAVREAEVRSKAPVGMAQVISLAGRWAMRPQTAMAAVFLLIVGTSSVIFSRRAPKSAADAARASFTVTENGTPASPSPTTPARDEDLALDPQTAAAAHGPAAAPGRASAPVAAKSAPVASVEDPLAPAADKLAANDESAPSPKTQAYALPHAARSPSATGGMAGFGSMKPSANSQGADISPPMAPGGGGGFAAPPPPPAPPAKDDETMSALAAARAERDGGAGCAAAAAQFDAIASSAWGTATGYNATFEGAQCYARLGQMDAARSRFDRLLTVPAYASRAQAGINATSMMAAKHRAAPKAAAVDQAPAASPPAAAAPATPPADAPAAASTRK